MVDNRVHEREDGIAGALFEVGGGPAVASAGVEHGELELFLGGVEVDEEVVDGVQDLLRAGVGTVDLVDDHDGAELELQRLVQHETRLGQGALRAVDQQQDAVRHVQDAFHLAAEIAVDGSVDDIDLGVAVVYADVFREDGDAAFAFEFVAVEEAGVHFLVFAEELCLADDLVDERGLAVVDVRDDGDVSDVLHKCLWL